MKTPIAEQSIVTGATTIPRLGQILLRKKQISQANLEQALMEQQRQAVPLGELLVAKQFISRQQLNEALQEQDWRKKGFWLLAELGTPTF